MKLAELAYACDLFGKITDYNLSYRQLLGNTYGTPDLDKPEHRNALLVWLNQWGCRQFSPCQYPEASQELASWYGENVHLLPARDRDLWELTESELTAMCTAYAWLNGRKASHHDRDGRRLRITVGPTGTSKVLFAIRPRAAIPWDIPRRQTLGYDDSPTAYQLYLKYIKGIIDELGIECRQKGFEIADLPWLLGRMDFTVPKLIDEYLYITLTRKSPVPQLAELQRCAEQINSRLLHNPTVSIGA